jgi:hypothetical protein
MRRDARRGARSTPGAVALSPVADASADGTLSDVRPVEEEDLYQLPTG